MANTATDISFQVLRYAMEQVQNGDLNAAMDLGFTIEEIRDLEGLSMKEACRLGRLGGHFLRVQIDRKSYRALLQRVREDQASETLQDELLKQGAPRALMSELYGWSPSDYAHRRKILNLTKSCGRPPEATPDQEIKAWNAWCTRNQLPLPERYLIAAQAASISIATLCHLLTEWAQTNSNRKRLRS
ncbi:STY4526/YPO1902 family pathogenicity island replication protein [Ectothiorhodospira variabilis]|uniref:STY4526/YPO1902 family pathogenicity island replication protein n=1 Tax=Ectothiorhodospira variabilis TaxID=505694 RepID=UPI001EFAF4DB|nr:STY4526/YPO1902 family pathogenicity island replication protein [Ectothiorhodospira variabilis]MCG5495520.1 DUF2857 domain-containing protein [Ectothiorhodospira variabilis]MCG5505128.1 DUF2857 domain-containing protein [Ectothiorhodospira variabilis]MCG5508285.1 DUF2857 domain-containing protein [Ectothiorhodospira variabilis]